MKPFRMRRRIRGSIIVEYSSAIVVLIMLFIFPFVNLVTLGIRYAILVEAVHSGADAASDCNSYTTQGGTIPDSSAIVKAVPLQVNSFLTGKTGIVLNSDSPKSRILVTSIPNPTAGINAVTTFNAWNTPLPLTSVPNPALNIYAIEVECNATLRPLVPFNIPLLNGVPGMGASWPVTIASQQVVEYPAGLNQ